MKAPVSIRARLIVGGAVLLVAFLLGAGLAVQRAHENSVRTAHFARLQATVYLLLAAAEIRPDGRLEMPPALAEPRLSVPGSGLYASISHSEAATAWPTRPSGTSNPWGNGATKPWRRTVATPTWRPATACAGPTRAAMRRWCCRCWKTA
jgi:two-component system sensor histidine kinase PhoQ